MADEKNDIVLVLVVLVIIVILLFILINFLNNTAPGFIKFVLYSINGLFTTIINMFGAGLGVLKTIVDIITWPFKQF
ncbi:MAG: hypothetical protein COW47_02430 [Candidatus Huberarchaeum crystalense]|uniref:Uncharacterized protein n=1 Tax=Huberarchaeum crystalense TaxID=2014257 RepID=A0A2G9LJT3_HUBC1|nr:hypothetical protein [archaeon]OIP20328.1 MAG: hypothetical protein AUJ91_01560 [archaeon CG2_30_31_98]PIN66440.1 MAG: hypothetical protein COW69_02310 [Candidatus Huberarchaeum crystalense]NCS98403.1 hypothetical protein [archaeon]PIV13640.1 MAG: hypothetical protein COS45_01790 [Candidatus Huberarchaeum crystalense]